MPTIRFQHRDPLSCSGKDSLMQELLDGGLPVASSCHGDGVCGKCRVIVLEGEKNLTAPTDLEEGLRERFHLRKNERISCQCQVLGDVKVTTTYW